MRWMDRASMMRREGGEELVYILDGWLTPVFI
jgi:hypothetical protein